MCEITNYCLTFNHCGLLKLTAMKSATDKKPTDRQSDAAQDNDSEKNIDSQREQYYA